MPKYVLGPDGKITSFVERSPGISVGSISPSALTKKHINTLAGDPHYESNPILDRSDIEIAYTPLIDDDVSPNVRREKPVFEGDSFFPKKNTKFNSSFGAGKSDVLESRSNFNDYVTRGQIFATELEMISGADFNSLGINDLTKFTVAIELFVEALIYITIIEGIILLETTTQPQNNIIGYDKGEASLGNYGPVSTSALTKYINNVLNYPYQRENIYTGSSSFLNIRKSISNRIGAYFIGLNEFVNADPLLYLDKIKLPGIEIKSSNFITDKDYSEELIQNIIYYYFESLTSLSNIGSNRLVMLVRKFNTQKDWHENKLYSAKDVELTRENAFEKYLVQFNYYYVKFIIERMNIGLKIKRYHRNKGNSSKLFNRSGRLKESKRGIYRLHYDKQVLSFRKHNQQNDDEVNRFFSDETFFKEGSLDLERNKNRQSISNAVLPQAFIMPLSLEISRAINIEKNYSGETNLTKHFVEEHVKSYFLRTGKDQERLSQDVVKKMELYYEKEMMPFYFQDLRTNEVIGFHAFIESITDNYNPNYTSTKGFGRIDDIKHYVDTTRNVNLTFMLAAMSKEDHDLMWYQINKIVSMVYPQWSRGFKIDKLSGKDNKKGLEYPFTQVPTSSPLIRIRLGDVLKSNYTKHAIEKIHGSGHNKVNREVKDEYDYKPKPKRYVKPGTYTTISGEEVIVEKLSPINKEDINLKDYNKSKSQFLKVKIKINDPIDDILSIDSANELSSDTYLVGGVTEYQIPVLGLEPLTEPIERVILVKPENISNYFEPVGKQYNDDRDDFIKHRKAFKDYTQSYTKEDEINNPLTAAYESTLGKGLAGFITMLDVNYQDQLWETEVRGSKAPKAVKISINFAPLHDIPPGLDADGAMRAPVYNAGRIVNGIYGDVYDDDDIFDDNAYGEDPTALS